MPTKKRTASTERPGEPETAIQNTSEIVTVPSDGPEPGPAFQTDLESNPEAHPAGAELHHEGPLPQTDFAAEENSLPGPAEQPEKSDVPQIDLKTDEKASPQGAFSDPQRAEATEYQTEPAIGESLEPEAAVSPQTDSEPQKELPERSPSGEELPPEPAAPQIDSVKAENGPDRRKTAQKRNQFGETTIPEPEHAAESAGAGPRPRKRRASVKPAPVLSIDERPSVETQADRARNDLLDLLESQKTGRVLTGTIQGVEHPANDAAHSLAVIYHGAFKVIIPAEVAVEPPADYRGRLPTDVLHYMLTKRLGAEVDFIVRGIDPDSGIAAASRLDAMRAKRRQYYWGTDRDGNNLIHSGVCAEARVVSVIRAGIFVDLFGLESYIPLRELSYQRWMDAAGHFQPGQRILVKVLEIERTGRDQVKVSVSVKQAGENPYERALRRYSAGNCYVGTVSMVDTNGVFVALDGGIDCLCSYPKRGRPPRGARVTVRILGINHEANRIWGAITHIAAPR